MSDDALIEAITEAAHAANNPMIPWFRVDPAAKKRKLRSMRAALAAIEASGHRVVPVEALSRVVAFVWAAADDDLSIAGREGEVLLHAADIAIEIAHAVGLPVDCDQSDMEHPGRVAAMLASPKVAG